MTTVKYFLSHLTDMLSSPEDMKMNNDEHLYGLRTFVFCKNECSRRFQHVLKVEIGTC